MREALPLALAALGLGVALVLLAAPARPDDPDLVEPWVRRLDLDASGCVDADEAASTGSTPAVFAALDANDDGCLGPAELEVLLTHVDPRAFEAPAR